MTITTTADPPSVASLEERIQARRAEIIAKLVEIKAETGIEAAKTRDTLKAKLSELGHIIKQTVVDGWASISDAGKQRLDRWLAS
jgi:hypothetical protein